MFPYAEIGRAASIGQTVRNVAIPSAETKFPAHFKRVEATTREYL
jgi:hypothetical protein